MNAYPRYRLEGVTGARPIDLHTHLAEHDAPCTVRACDVYADGSCGGYRYTGAPASRQSAPVRLLHWCITVLLGTAVSLLIDARLWARWRGMQAEPRVVAARADVRLIVPPARAAWAELLLLKWAEREGWRVTPHGRAWADPSNPSRARANPRAPIPLGRVRARGMERGFGL